jgi:hypothetical protein
VLATKVWGQMSDDPADRGLSAAQIGKQAANGISQIVWSPLALAG